VTLDEALKLPRIAIAGGPHTGKSYLGKQAADGRELLDTDTWINRFEWSELSRQVVLFGAARDRWVIEGVRVAHALRKGLEPDVVIWLTTVWPKPGGPRLAGHEAQAKAIRTVFEEWRRMNITGKRIPVVTE
jgi:hypothetical protein